MAHIPHIEHAPIGVSAREYGTVDIEPLIGHIGSTFCMGRSCMGVVIVIICAYEEYGL